MVLTLLKTTTQLYILNKYVIINLMYILLPKTCIKLLYSRSWTSFLVDLWGLTGNISIVPGGPGKPSAPGRPARPGGP